MEKYQNFVETVNLLMDSVEKMKTAKTRQEVEELELNIKDYFRAMIVKSSYIQADIHNFALEQVGRIAKSNVESTLGK